MSDYPDPDEEFELMYADDLELLREEDDRDAGNIVKRKSLPAKRSLDFSSPAPKKPPDSNLTSSIPKQTYDSDISLTPNLPLVEDLLTPPIACNKRTVDDLFGDIGDIDLEDVQLPSKRMKTDEENDLELIDKIIEGRKMMQLLSEPTGRMKSKTVVYDIKDNISLNIPRWAFIPLTNSDGDRMYVRLESEDSWDKSLDSTAEHQSLHSSYISTWEEARKILEAKKEHLIEDSHTQLPAVDIDTSSGLWVDKYRPQSYLDLLSEEPVNRALLHWLHLWDKIVFKKEVKTKEPQQKNSFSKRSGQFQLTNKWRGKKETEPELDEDGRPHHKVALLCGPPGVGKTTLAHLLARIAGYRPVELNASDERSTEAFRTALQSATLMRSVIDTERRPNCLILDEIDGAPLPTVELLVKWCTATVAEQGKKKAKTQPLKRPVIAICNDLYATSLRPLRPVSLIIRVGGVSVSRLTARLALVARHEGLHAGAHVLAALAARAQGDVRHAIQVLSFVRSRAKEQLKMEDVENASIGTKDLTKSLLQALTAVFTVHDKDPGGVLRTVQAAGEYDRLAEGIFENYLTARVDPRLLVACETLSWLRLYDTVNTWTMRAQNYSLYGLLALCIARCNHVLATRATQRLNLAGGVEVSRKKAELDSIVECVWRGSSPAVAATRSALQLDLIPLLPHLLSPALRSANVQLCSENERKSLRTCAGAMCDYGLQYVQQRTPEGLYAFQLEPDIYRVAFFGTEERARPNPSIRQAIAREQQLETIRRNDEMANRVSGRPASTTKNPAAVDKHKPAKPTNEPSLPNHLQRLKPKEINKIQQVHKDFFGRVVPMSQMPRSESVPDVISSSTVFYQYQEGFNNAVRRNVRTKDIL